MPSTRTHSNECLWRKSTNLIKDQDSKEECDQLVYDLEDTMLMMNMNEKEPSLTLSKRSYRLLCNKRALKDTFYLKQDVIHGKFCDVIIENGSIENIMSKALI